jgi:hypothetical protein
VHISLTKRNVTKKFQTDPEKCGAMTITLIDSAKNHGPDYVEDILPHQAVAIMPPTVILRQNVE